MSKGWKMAVGVLSLAVVLAGCGAKEETVAEQQGQVQTGTQGGTQQGGGGAGSPGMGMGIQADLMGKVKSVDGQSITVYKSNMTFGGGRGQGDGTGQPPEGGEMPQPPADGQPPSGDAQQGAGGGGGGPMNTENMFSEETATIQVTDATKIVSVTFENNEMVEKTVALADLNADDILSVDLKDDTLEVVTITLRTGGFGGGGGRQRPNDDQQQQPTEPAQ